VEQQEEWQLERRFFSEVTMAKIPELVEPLVLTDADSPDPAPPFPSAIRCTATTPSQLFTYLLDR
jgi:hypothetical protein